MRNRSVCFFIGNGRCSKNMSNNSLISVSLNHLDDVVSKFRFNNGRYLSLLQTKCGSHKRRVPTLVFTTDLVFPSAIFAPWIFRVQFSHLLKGGGLRFD